MTSKADVVRSELKLIPIIALFTFIATEAYAFGSILYENVMKPASSEFIAKREIPQTTNDNRMIVRVIGKHKKAWPYSVVGGLAGYGAAVGCGATYTVLGGGNDPNDRSRS